MCFVCIHVCAQCVCSVWGDRSVFWIPETDCPWVAVWVLRIELQSSAGTTSTLNWRAISLPITPDPDTIKKNTNQTYSRLLASYWAPNYSNEKHLFSFRWHNWKDLSYSLVFSHWTPSPVTFVISSCACQLFQQRTNECFLLLTLREGYFFPLWL